MKTIKFFAVFIIVLNMACAQQAAKTLDGKSFQISCWDVNQPDKQDPDLLIFKNGMLDSEACHQYGFTAAPYESNSANGTLNFSSTILSPTDGSIKIDGNVKDNSITGKMIWKKAGQADINYDYKGNLKSE
ncbi:MAG: hypothetical protein M3Q56_07920 [Bacteroidota bacterium]|nr:hypothetical protein [Bacteroidota bacterium]